MRETGGTFQPPESRPARAPFRPAVVSHMPAARYGAAPFHPPCAYPELGFLGADARQSDNTSYALVRRSLRCYDTARFGTTSWNPLGEIVTPGQTVVVKPNLVIHDRTPGHETRTHAAVLRAILDYVYLALAGDGRVVVCDAPIQGADFSRMARQSGLDEVVRFYKDVLRFPVALIDLRTEWARIDDSSGFICERIPLPGDPLGSTEFDLGSSSAFEEPSAGSGRLAVGDYSSAGISENHGPGVHRYRFSNTVLVADVVLNVGKMKTHQKAGITGALKNAVGMNTSKDCLPHYRAGAPPVGDEYPASAFNSIVANVRTQLQERVPLAMWRGLRAGAELARHLLARRPGGGERYGLISGSWAGNDTIWRMIVDINRILRSGTREGVVARQPARRVYHFIDGIVAGEGDGPLRSTPKQVGLFLHGGDAVALDATMAAVMGFDPLRIPLIRAVIARQGCGLTPHASLDEIPVSFDEGAAARLRSGGHFDFTPPRGWSAVRRSVSPELLRLLADDTGTSVLAGGTEP